MGGASSGRLSGQVRHCHSRGFRGVAPAQEITSGVEIAAGWIFHTNWTYPRLLRHARIHVDGVEAAPAVRQEQSAVSVGCDSAPELGYSRPRKAQLRVPDG